VAARPPPRLFSIVSDTLYNGVYQSNLTELWN